MMHIRSDIFLTNISIDLFLILRHRKELDSLFQWRRLFCTVLLCKTMLKSTAEYSQQYNGNVLNKKNK